MFKIQVQIPDALYKRAKQVAAEKEWSFAEVVRKGLEYVTRTNPPGRHAASKWRLPGPYHLGSFRAAEEKWTELAHGE
ncbi:MAG TPA: antitoxin [Verrucomicrobiae bacterium]|nr:antitoxin [Verrucomicrobiae bacterium]